jgi:hypothetical protein
MEDVVSALHNTLGKKGMSYGDIRKLAEYLMSFSDTLTRSSIIG